MEKSITGIIQDWRKQRETLNQDLENNIYSGLSVSTKDSPEHQLEDLCERLMDYISSGHFEVYEQLLQDSGTRPVDQNKLIKDIYRHIQRSTDKAVQFNDKYDCDGLCTARNNKNDETLPADLYRLNQALSVRYVLEEQLVEILHS